MSPNALDKGYSSGSVEGVFSEVRALQTGPNSSSRSFEGSFQKTSLSKSGSPSHRSIARGDHRSRAPARCRPGPQGIQPRLQECVGPGEGVVAVVEHTFECLGQLPADWGRGWLYATGRCGPQEAAASGRRCARCSGRCGGARPRRKEGRIDETVAHDLKVQDVKVEGGGAFEIGDPQVRVADADLRVDGFAYDDVLLSLTAHATKGSYLRTTTGSIPYLDYLLALIHSSASRDCMKRGRWVVVRYSSRYEKTLPNRSF